MQDDPKPEDQTVDPEPEVPEGEETPTGGETIVKEKIAWYEEALKDPTPENVAKVVNKIKGYDKEFSRKMNQVTLREREVADVAEKLKTAATQPKSPEAVTKKQDKIFDAWLESTSDPGQRELIRKIRDGTVEIAREASDSGGKLQERIDRLEKQLQTRQSSDQVTRESTLNSEIAALGKRLGLDIVEKHREQILSLGVQYPQYSARRLLYSVADPDELEQALEIGKKRSPKGTADQPTNHRSPVTSTSPTPEANKYKGKTPQEMQAGLRLAIRDSIRASRGRLGIR